MQRRSFLGTVLGFIAGTQIPFYADKPAKTQPTSSKLAKWKQILRIFELDQYTLKTFKGILVTTDGVKISSTEIKEVDLDIENLIAKFKFNEVNMIKALNLRSIIVVDDLSYEINEFKFYSLNVVNGDVLKVDTTLNIGQSSHLI